MPLNLITDPWIPATMRDGSVCVIAPWRIADPDVITLAWDRPDFNVACLEFLIGLIYLVDPPTDDEDWEEREAPDADRLCARLLAVASAFNLLGDGPLFLQDLEPLEGALNSPDMLFIDSAGEATEKNNADLMVHRARYVSLAPATAAMALYTFQAFAPSGGAGNRTSMRGGGPLVTLVDPRRGGDGLWPLIWANVPCGQPSDVHALPWMRETVVSKGGEKVWPPTDRDVAVETFFDMPRRLRLMTDGDGNVAGVVQRPHGNNYAGWVHPLSPYYRMKVGGELLPQHPRPGLFGYRHWLGTVAANPDGEMGGLRLRAATVRGWHERSQGRPAEVIVAGWAMSNMKPLDFTWSVAPLVQLPATAALMLSGLVEAASVWALALRHNLAPVLGEGEARETVREAFFSLTQGAFESRLAALQAGEEPGAVTHQWLVETRAVALHLFDEQALAGLPDRTPEQQQAIIQARRFLLASFAGHGTYGKQAFAALQMQPVSHGTAQQTEEVTA
jgi:CRISPR system Cascade subunit CasA